MRKIVALLLTTLVLTGCNVNKEKQRVEPDPIFDPSLDPEYETSLYKIQNEDELYKQLYKYENKISITLDFTNQAIKKLQDYGNTRTIQKDMYHPCKMTLKINKETHVYEEAGARMKGNTSRTNSFVRDDNTFDKNRFINLKLSFNQTFDKAEDNNYYIKKWESKDIKKDRKNRRFGGQKKIDLKWKKIRTFLSQDQHTHFMLLSKKIFRLKKIILFRSQSKMKMIL